MIPEKETLLQRIASTQYTVITERGRKEPYPFNNLFKIPEEFTTEGLEDDFLEYFKSLEAQGKQMSLINFSLYFKWIMLRHAFVSALYKLSGLILPLLISMYLSWLSAPKKEAGILYGVVIQCLITLASLLLLYSGYQLNYLCLDLPIRFSSALGVNLKKF